MIYKIDISSQSLERIIHEAIEEFICKDRVLLQRELSERALCGALMKRIYDVLASKGFEDFKDYFVDVEFNIIDPFYMDGRLMTCRHQAVIGNDYGSWERVFFIREEAEEAE